MTAYLKWLAWTLVGGTVIAVVLIWLFPRQTDQERLAERLETAPFTLYLPEFSNLRPYAVGGQSDLMNEDGPVERISVLYLEGERVTLPVAMFATPEGQLCGSTDLALPPEATCTERGGVVRASYPGYVGRAVVRDGTTLWVLLPEGDGPPPQAIEEALRTAPRVSPRQLAAQDRGPAERAPQSLDAAG